MIDIFIKEEFGANLCLSVMTSVLSFIGGDCNGIVRSISIKDASVDVIATAFPFLTIAVSLSLVICAEILKITYHINCAPCKLILRTRP